MRCPNCGSNMTLDDMDEDYGRINWVGVVVRRTTWWVCSKCNYGAQREDKYTFFDEEGTEIKIKEDTEE